MAIHVADLMKQEMPGALRGLVIEDIDVTLRPKAHVSRTLRPKALLAPEAGRERKI